MGLMFGTDETITCIQHVEIKGPGDESMCLAYKTSKLFIGAGVKLTDEGYVLGVEEKGSNVTKFIKLDAAKIQDLQQQQLLPVPLPKYEIPVAEYLFGYSLWIILPFVALFYWIAAMRKKSRIQARAAEAAGTPISYGPPQLLTKADRFMTEQVTPQLQPGETIQHQAYTFDRVPDGSMIGTARTTARFVVLTSKRLFLIKTRVGAFGVLCENKETEVLDRARIKQLSTDDRLMNLYIDDGSVRTLWVHTSKKVSNQHKFLLDVPRILQAQPSAVAI